MHLFDIVRRITKCLLCVSDEDDDDCAVVMKSEDEDLIFVGMSPATISGSEDEDESKSSAKDDDDIVFISSTSPQVEVLKTESAPTTNERESEPSGFTGYDPFGKDATDTCTDTCTGASLCLDQTADTSPLPTDKPCGWVSHVDISVPILSIVNNNNSQNGADTDTLNTPKVDLSTDLNLPTNDSGGSASTAIQPSCSSAATNDTTAVSSASDSNDTNTKMDTSTCDNPGSGWLGKCEVKPCTSSMTLDDQCQSSSVSSVMLTSSKDPMISGQSSDRVDRSAISNLLHQLKSLADCSNNSLPTNPSASHPVRKCGFTGIKCRPKKSGSTDSMPDVTECRHKYYKAMLKGCGSKSSNDVSTSDKSETPSSSGCIIKCNKDLPSLLKRAKKHRGSLPARLSLKRRKSHMPITSLLVDLKNSLNSSQSDESDSDTSTRVSCGSPVGSVSDFPAATPSTSTATSSTSDSTSGASCSYKVTSCSSDANGLKMRVRLLQDQIAQRAQELTAKPPLMPPKARHKLNRQSFSGADKSQATCCSCGEKNSENSFSACLQWHFTCQKCLEKSAKELLTNSKKVRSSVFNLYIIEIPYN